MVDPEEAPSAPKRSTKPRVTAPSKSKSRGRKKAVEADPSEAEAGTEAEADEPDNPEDVGDSQAGTEQEDSQPPEPASILTDEKPKIRSNTKAKPKTAAARGRPKKVKDVLEGEEEDEGVEREEIEESGREDRRETIKPFSPPPYPPPRPLSQLDRFTNIPPSSPPASISHAIPSPRPITSKPARPSPHAHLSRDALDKSIHQGAMEARRVIHDRAAGDGGGTKEDLRAPLTDDQKGMTLEELVRSEMRRRYEVMEREGEKMIGRWEERTAESRKHIEMI